MTERNFGETTSTWIGTVVNVMDPYQSGRVQVRVLGRHDDEVNIPDEDLPWAGISQPVTSAGIGRVGTAPVGLVVGSRVHGNWLDRDFQYPMIIGVIGRAGAPIPGQTENGAPAINTEVGSIPGAAQNSAANPYTSLDPNRINISAVNAGEVNITNVSINQGVVVTNEVATGMAYANTPTTAAADPNENNVLSALNQVDPSNSISALQCFPPAAFNINLSIDLGSIVAGLVNLVADALTRALLDLMEQLGINSVLRALDQAAFALANFRSAFDALTSGGICGAPAALTSIDRGTQALARAYTNIQIARERGANSTATLRRTLGYTREEILSRAPTTAFRPVSVVVNAPAGYVQEYYSYNRDPYPGYIRWTDPTRAGDPVFTLRNGQPNFRNANQHASFDVSGAVQSSLVGLIRTGNLNTTNLQSVLLQATGIAQVSALRGVIGSGNPAQIIAAAARVAPALYGSVTGLFAPSVSISVLPNTDAIGQAMQRFTQAQTVLAVRATQLDNAVRSI